MLIALIAVVVVLIFAVGGPFLVYFHQTYPSLRASMVLGKDLFIGFGTVAGILLAAENLRRAAVSARTSVALRLVERWNDPKTAGLWTRWHELHHELTGKSESDVVSMVSKDDQSTVADVLNFLEEIATSVNTKAADDRQIWLALGPTIMEYFDTLLPWRS